MEKDTKKAVIDMFKNSDGTYEMAGLADTLNAATIQRLLAEKFNDDLLRAYDGVMNDVWNRGFREEDLQGGFVSRFTHACQEVGWRKSQK